MSPMFLFVTKFCILVKSMVRYEVKMFPLFRYRRVCIATMWSPTCLVHQHPRQLQVRLRLQPQVRRNHLRPSQQLPGQVITIRTSHLVAAQVAQNVTYIEAQYLMQNFGEKNQQKIFSIILKTFLLFSWVVREVEIHLQNLCIFFSSNNYCFQKGRHASHSGKHHKNFFFFSCVFYQK